MSGIASIVLRRCLSHSAVLAGRGCVAIVHLHSGPWDGKEVGVRDPRALVVQVNGPRHGNHWVWITHLYVRRGDPYEFRKTEVTEIERPQWLSPD